MDVRMKVVAAAMASLCQIAASSTHASPNAKQGANLMLTPDDIRMVAPALEKYNEATLRGDVWKRPDLTPRDRSIVTLAALIARNQTIEKIGRASCRERV